MSSKISKKVISTLPKFMKLPIIRSTLKLPMDTPEGLEFRFVSSKEEFLKASRLLHDCYVEFGYMKEDPQGLRLTPYHLLPTTLNVIALWEGEVIGTLLIIRDNVSGLPMDKTYDLSPLRKNGKVLAEISGLAIHPKYRASKGALFHYFIRYFWRYAKEWHGLDYFVIAVNPAMSDFYEAFYMFKPMNLNHVINGYEFANGAPAVALKIPVETSFDIFKSTYKNKPDVNNLYTFMTKSQLSTEIYPFKEYYTLSDNYLNQFTFRDIYKSVPDFNSRFSENIKNDFSRIYGFKNFEDLVDKQKTARLRHEIRTLGLISDEKSRHEGVKLAPVFDISKNGLKLKANEVLDKNNYSLTVTLGPNKKSNLIAEPVWNTSTGETGLKIISHDDEWEKMNNSIELKIKATLPKPIESNLETSLPFKKAG